ncbi:MAG: 2Fe-2S iron-sulfur cluster binding domain-containing protein [Rhodospirillaceae bacterium]|nr:MAG: 2Fe-2S iron-sulfur cluster binding domain-containing protein [Rhodospirillaceae bacterium]
MVAINVIDRKGQKRVIKAAGGSLMEALRDNDLDVEAICGGCCSCCTCHVFIAPTWAAKLPPCTADEKDLLEGSSFNRPGESRLSCQIRMSDALDGLEVTVAPPD